MDSVYEAWVSRYNGPANLYDGATGLAVDDAGNVYVTGWGNGSGTSGDYATIKYDISGFQEWVARYNGVGNGDDNAYALSLDGFGNLYVTGASVDTGYDYATIKYDASGVEQWVARFNGSGDSHDHAYALAVDGLGNVYVTGYSVGSGTNGDCVTIKYDDAGVEQWVVRYNGPGNGNDFPSALAVDGLGNVYVAGQSLGSGTSDDCITIKYDDSGVEQWVARYNGPGNGIDQAKAVAIDAVGDIYVAGSSSSDYVAIKYDASGGEQWIARYDGPNAGSDLATALALDGSGNVYVTGYSSGVVLDYATVKYDAAGAEEWVARYDGPGNEVDLATALVVDDSGSVYVTGYSTSAGLGYDYATIKYDDQGNEEWVARYNGPGNYDDYARALAIDSEGSVYVSGESYGTGMDWDYATIKYDQIITGYTPEPELPQEFSLDQNYPNPFNPTTTISFSIPRSGEVSLKIFNLLGEEVVTLVSGNREADTHTVQWDATGQPSGVYFYRLRAGEFVEMRKLVLLR